MDTFNYIGTFDFKYNTTQLNPKSPFLFSKTGLITYLGIEGSLTNLPHPIGHMASLTQMYLICFVSTIMSNKW